jgi:cytochrome b561
MENYSLISKLLHWATVIMILMLFPLGVYMIDLGYYDRNYTLSYSIHKSLGLIALLLGLCQLVWALAHKAPAPLSSLRIWEKFGASAMHKTLFVLIILMPASGYFIAAAAGQGVDIFGWLTIPAVLPDDLDFGELAVEDVASATHYYLVYGSAILVLLHILAALKHHFIDKDRTLRRISF